MTRLAIAKRDLAPPQILLALLVVAVGIGLRFIAISRSYWFDEIATVVHSDLARFTELLTASAEDKQPPLYYSIVFWWIRLFGRSEIAIRSISLIFGLLALCTPWLAKDSVSHREKIVTLSILCAMSLPIRYAEEARNYSLLLCFSCAALFSYYEWLKTEKAASGTVFYISLVLLAATHLFGLLLSMSYIAVMFVSARKLAVRAALAAVAIALSGAVLTPMIMQGATKAAGGHFWITFTVSSLITNLLVVFTPVGIILLAYSAWVWRRDVARPAMDPALLQAAAPFLLMFVGSVVISLHTPILTDRNMIGLLAPFALIIARLTAGASPRGTTLLVLLICLLLAQSAVLMVTGRMFIREDYRAIARRSIEANTRVCYVIPDGYSPEWAWQAASALYVSKIFKRSDLAPKSIALSGVAAEYAAKDCRLWADGHPDSSVSILRSTEQFRSCSNVPLGADKARITSVLVSC